MRLTSGCTAASVNVMPEKTTNIKPPTGWTSEADSPVSYRQQVRQERDPLLVQLHDEELATAVWDYDKQPTRYGLHGLIKYPAMMVPQMQGDLLDAALRVDPAITEVLDPFVGAGTTLVESRARRLNFTGIDINPLAILACRAKSGPLHAQAYAAKVTALQQRVSLDRGKAIDADFPERCKWFSASASVELSRIRRAIRSEPSLWARRLMWLAFAGTVRAVSNSRTSTYKLHIRSADEIAEIPSAIEHFREAISDSVARVTWHEEELCNRGVLQKERVARSIHTYCGSITDFSLRRAGFADLIITSPPYGDNRSTVPYGQFSYLQLRWISAEDLPLGVVAFQNAYAVDGRSLGGSLRGSLEYVARLSTASIAAKNFVDALAVFRRRDLMSKSLAFLRDYERALRSAVSLLRLGGYAIWTVGDRRVGGLRLPLGKITAEMLECCGMRAKGHIERTILQKRTPQRNSLGSTMNEERVLVTKKESCY